MVNQKDYIYFKHLLALLRTIQAWTNFQSVNIPGCLFLRWGSCHLCAGLWGRRLHSHTSWSWWSCRWCSSCAGTEQSDITNNTEPEVLALNMDDFPSVSKYLIMCYLLPVLVYHDDMFFELMWNNRWRSHSLAFWCHSVDSYCYLCSPTPFSEFKCNFWVTPWSKFMSTFHLRSISRTPCFLLVMSLPSSYLSLLGGWIAPLPVVSAGVPCSRPSTCRWCGGYHRNRIP